MSAGHIVTMGYGGRTQVTLGYGVSSWTAIVSIISDFIFRRVAVSRTFKKEEPQRIFKHGGVD